ncbi:MAG: amidohydrolase family protein [Burkholderiales bacterium]|nr:amidohydrolase family protein [Burkholderiales bacterium]
MSANTPTTAAPLCAAPDFNPHPPKFRMPAKACDTHAHVMGPAARYDYSGARVYTPPDCLPAQYRHMLDTLGVERAVLIQPSVYGTDNAAMLDAMKADPQRLRGVAVVDPAIGDAELKQMDAAGIRGVRVNIVDVKDRKPGTLPLDVLRPLAARIKPMGWHMEFLMHANEFPDLDKSFADFPVPIVLGHLGYMKGNPGTDDPGFQALLRLMQAGKAWVKLTGPYRISAQPLPHADTIPYAHALIKANAAQVIWGTDWPHVMHKGQMPNDGDLSNLLLDWVPDEKQREQVLVGNPTRLYGF